MSQSPELAGGEGFTFEGDVADDDQQAEILRLIARMPIEQQQALLAQQFPD